MGFGAPTLANIQAGSYTGDGTNDRNINVGFPCAAVIVYHPAATARMWISLKDANACCKLAAAGVSFAADLVVNATDGFDVDADHTNANGETYYYVAIGE